MNKQETRLWLSLLKEQVKQGDPEAEESFKGLLKEAPCLRC